jgi:hypothetical protein
LEKNQHLIGAVEKWQKRNCATHSFNQTDAQDNPVPTENL